MKSRVPKTPFEHYGNGILKGLLVTLKNFTRRPVTVQYPEQRLNVSRRIRGNELIWNNVKCTGCATCAKACPQGAIEIITSRKGDRYEVQSYRVDTGYCISCGLCVEACPYEAVHMGYAYERAKYGRNELVQEGEALLASEKRKPSGYMHPEIAKELPKQTLLLEKIVEKK